MKRIVAMVAMLATVFTATAEMARSEWHAKVGACAQNPALLQQTIGQLSAADQLAFLGEVNEAISAMPGSKDQKAAAFYAANKAAVLGATRENRTAVLAEVYATVPVEMLTVINERFAAELLNRKSAPSVTNKRFVEISTNVMAAVVQRTSKTENANVRAAFATIMLVRASGGVEGLGDTLADMTPDSKDTKEWIGPAIGEKPSYDGPLGSAGAGEEPNKNNVNTISPPTGGESGVLGDLPGGSDTGSTSTPSTGPSTGPSAGPSVGPSTGPSAGSGTGPSAGPGTGPSAGPGAGPGAGTGGGSDFSGGIFVNPTGGAIVPGTGTTGGDTTPGNEDGDVNGAGTDSGSGTSTTVPKDSMGGNDQPGGGTPMPVYKGEDSL